MACVLPSFPLLWFGLFEASNLWCAGTGTATGTGTGTGTEYRLQLTENNAHIQGHIQVQIRVPIEVQIQEQIPIWVQVAQINQLLGCFAGIILRISLTVVHNFGVLVGFKESGVVPKILPGRCRQRPPGTTLPIQTDEKKHQLAKSQTCAWMCINVS